jgi:hypothetical protein
MQDVTNPVSFSFLGAFAKFRKKNAFGFFLSVRLSVWNNSASSGGISMKFDI